MSVSQIINVIVNSKGAVTVKKQLDDIGNSAKTTTTYLNSMRAILAAAMTFSGLGRITETADMFTVLNNRLRQVTDSTDQVGASWSRLMEIANSSYSTIDSTVNLYFRVAQAYRAWGESAEAAYEFTDKFQKAAILSGSSMQTTAQAVYQFGQALNKGKLDGDEFRSVMEGLPYVTSIIQKELNVTRAELYKMGAEGKITLDKMKVAFERAAKTIESDWKNITPTIGMAINVLRSNWVNFIGEIQTSTGVFSIIASAILLVANNFNILAAALTPVAVTLSFIAGRLVLGLVVNGFKDLYTAIMRVIPMIAALNAAMWANPFLLAAGAIAAVVAVVIYFRNELGLTNEVLSSIWEMIKSVFTSIVQYAMSIISPIVDVVANFVNWREVLNTLIRVAAELWNNLTTMFQSVAQAAGQAAAYVWNEFKPVFIELWELAKNLGELIMDIAKTHFGFLVAAIKAVQPVFKSVWDFIQPALVKFIAFLGDVLTGWKNIASWLSENFMPVVRDVFEGWLVIIQAVISAINALISALRTALALMRQVTGGSSAGGGGGTPGANYGAQFYAGEFATGGGFKVGGTGAGRDTTSVAFRANRGERVTVETKKQQRANDAANQNMVPEVNVPVQVVNVLDAKMMVDALDSDYAEKRIINVFKKNRDDILDVLGVS